jgi:hypothetical protein
MAAERQRKEEPMIQQRTIRCIGIKRPLTAKGLEMRLSEALKLAILGCRRPSGETYSVEAFGPSRATASSANRQ